MRVVVTGAGGFVGRALAARLPACTRLSIGGADWQAALARTDFRGATVFHLAARVHERGARERDWQHDNVDKTLALAEAAARGGASRLVFASTIKVHGEETRGRPFREDDAMQPDAGYAASKARAEIALRDLSKRTGLAVAIVRPALVFGAGAKANLHRLLRLADTPLPLPFASIENRRSWVHVEDLCDLLVLCGHREEARGRAFMACGPEPFSTPALVTALRQALARPRRLFAMDARTIERAGAWLAQAEAVRPITRSLEGDSAAAREILGWRAARVFDLAVGDLVSGWKGSP
jgi:UDP-N-acetyl-alpha-D-quinovosamine dehydrogenase